MNIWFTSDTHFSHANIIKYCNRPFGSSHYMNKVLTEEWNNLVGIEDIVYHLGDFSFHSDAHIEYLNGKIILIYGNHDKRKHDHLFHEVHQTYEMKIGEFNCLLTHVPMIDDGYYNHKKCPDISLEKKYDRIICGHVHEKWKTRGKHVNVGVDVWNFKPIHINELIKFLEETK